MPPGSSQALQAPPVAESTRLSAVGPKILGADLRSGVGLADRSASDSLELHEASEGGARRSLAVGAVPELLDDGGLPAWDTMEAALVVSESFEEQVVLNSVDTAPWTTGPLPAAVLYQASKSRCKRCRFSSADFS